MKILNRLFARPKSELDRAKQSEAAFCKAYERYADACRRGDTRAQAETWPALKDARTAQLMGEVWL